MKKLFLSVAAGAAIGALAYGLTNNSADSDASDEQEEPKPFKLPSSLVALGVKLLPVMLALGHKLVDDIDAAVDAALDGDQPNATSPANDTAPTE